MNRILVRVIHDKRIPLGRKKEYDIRSFKRNIRNTNYCINALVLIFFFSHMNTGITSALKLKETLPYA